MSDEYADETARPYTAIVRNWLESHRGALLVFLGIFVAGQIVLNIVIGTHNYIYQFEIYTSNQFSNVSWWMLIIDSAVWVGVLWILFDSRNSTESAETSNDRN